jgi:hypothetical protein
MDKENVVYIHNGISLTLKKSKFMSFAGKWMEVEITMLSEISQTQTNITNSLS